MSFIKTNRYLRLNRAIREELLDTIYNSTYGRTYNPVEYRAIYESKQLMERFPPIMPPEDEFDYDGDDYGFAPDGASKVAALSRSMDTVQENARIDDYVEDMKAAILDNFEVLHADEDSPEASATLREFEVVLCEALNKFHLKKEVDVVEFKEV